MYDKWFLMLFVIVLIFAILRERHYIFIYYTFWSFTIEIIYFTFVVFKVPRYYQQLLYNIVMAPSIVVALGFWLLIAPTYNWKSVNSNIFLSIVVHGINAIAIIIQKKEFLSIISQDFWKPVLFTTLYNIFLPVCIALGGRTKSGSIPYWYAQYDKAIGWIFGILAITSVGITHIITATYFNSSTLKKKVIQKDSKDSHEQSQLLINDNMIITSRNV